MPLPIIPPGYTPAAVTLPPVAGVTSPPLVGSVRIRHLVPPSLSVLGVASGASMRGPHRIYSTTDPDPVTAHSPALTIDLVEPPLSGYGWFTTVHADVPGRVNLSWVDHLSDVSEGTVELLQKVSDGAGALVANPGVVDWTPIRYMLCKLWGRPAMSLVREASVDTRINQGEESGETLALSQAPSSAIKMADTIIRPPGQLLQFPVQEDVRMDWTSPWVFSKHSGPGVFDYSGYNLPYATVSDTPLDLPTTFSQTPEGWPNRAARWIWDRVAPFPQGTCYFYKVPGLPHPGKYKLWTACKGPYEVWLNGVKVAEDTKAYTGQATQTEVFLDGAVFTANSSPGNFFAVKATAPSESRAGFLMSLYELNPNGTLGPYSYCTTDTTWRVVSYPAQPAGMTAGNILLSLLAQSVDTGGQFRWWGTTFNGATDSAGKPWPILRDVSFKVGSSILDALRQLADSDIDWRVWPTAYMLEAYAKDSLGATVDLELLSGYDDPSGNLRKLAYNFEA